MGLAREMWRLRGQKFFLLPRVREILRVFPGLYAHRACSDKTFAPALPDVPVFTGRDPYEPPTQRFDVAVVVLLLNPRSSAVEGLIFVWYFLNHLRTGIGLER